MADKFFTGIWVVRDPRAVTWDEVVFYRRKPTTTPLYFLKRYGFVNGFWACRGSDLKKVWGFTLKQGYARQLYLEGPAPGRNPKVRSTNRWLVRDSKQDGWKVYVLVNGPPTFKYNMGCRWYNNIVESYCTQGFKQETGRLFTMEDGETARLYVGPPIQIVK